MQSFVPTTPVHQEKCKNAGDHERRVDFDLRFARFLTEEKISKLPAGHPDDDPDDCISEIISAHLSEGEKEYAKWINWVRHLNLVK